jgi:hypothetical protein
MIHFLKICSTQACTKDFQASVEASNRKHQAHQNFKVPFFKGLSFAAFFGRFSRPYGAKEYYKEAKKMFVHKYNNKSVKSSKQPSSHILKGVPYCTELAHLILF